MRTNFRDLHFGHLKVSFCWLHHHPIALTLEHVSSVRGVFAYEDLVTHLHSCDCKQLQLTGIEQPTAPFQLEIGAPIDLQTVSIAATIDRTKKLDASIEVQELVGPKITAYNDLGRISGDVQATKIRGNSQGNTLTVTSGNIVLKSTQGTMGSWFARFTQAETGPIRVHWNNKKLNGEAASITGTNGTIRTPNFHLDLGHIQARSLTCHPNHLLCDELIAKDVHVTVGDLEKLPLGSHNKIFSIEENLLDLVHGQLNFDITIDATVPVLGRRTSTHHFRIPIEDGTINYKQLEGDLSTLESAFLDIELRGEHLVLSREVPLIPGTRKPLILWPLNQVEKALAAQKRIRLQTLLRYTIPEKEKITETLPVHHIHVNNIAGTFNVLPPPKHPAPHILLRNMKVTGQLTHQEEAPTDNAEACMSLDQLFFPFGSMHTSSFPLNVQEIHIDRIEDAKLSFRGLLPHRLEFKIKQLRCCNIELALNQG